MSSYLPRLWNGQNTSNNNMNNNSPADKAVPADKGSTTCTAGNNGNVIEQRNDQNSLCADSAASGNSTKQPIQQRQPQNPTSNRLRWFARSSSAPTAASKAQSVVTNHQKVVYRQFGPNAEQVLEIETEYSIPEPLQEDHVVLKVQVCVTCSCSLFCYYHSYTHTHTFIRHPQ